MTSCFNQISRLLPRGRRATLPVIIVGLIPWIVVNAFSASPNILRHVSVYDRDGRFGGWPANHGIWSWGDEILVGFSAGYYKDLGPDRHAIDRERPQPLSPFNRRDGAQFLDDAGEHRSIPC